jgi:hypothetical protein
VGMNETDLVSATVRTQETDTVSKVEPEKRQRDSQGRSQQEARREADSFEKTPEEHPQPETGEEPPAEPAPEPQAGTEPGTEPEAAGRNEDEDEPPKKHIDLRV